MNNVCKTWEQCTCKSCPKTKQSLYTDVYNKQMVNKVNSLESRWSDEATKEGIWSSKKPTPITYNSSVESHLAEESEEVNSSFSPPFHRLASPRLLHFKFFPFRRRMTADSRRRTAADGRSVIHRPSKFAIIRQQTLVKLRRRSLCLISPFLPLPRAVVGLPHSPPCTIVLLQCARCIQVLLPWLLITDLRLHCSAKDKEALIPSMALETTSFCWEVVRTTRVSSPV
jgi:hypothetical protein